MLPIPLKNQLKYFVKKHLLYENQIRIFVRDNTEVSYDSNQRLFEIRKALSYNERIPLRRVIMKSLKIIAPRHSIALGKIQLGYYDKCLQKYLYERINLKKENYETCWYEKAQNNKCVGFLPVEIPFDLEEKKRFIEEKSKHKSSWNRPELIELLHRDEQGFIYVLSSAKFDADDKVLSIYQQMKQFGFRQSLSIALPIIIGFSTSAKKHQIISGRHRIAALKYMESQNQISSETQILCHLVSYPFDSFVYTRPYETACIECINS